MFTLLKTDGAARLGELKTAGGVVKTPAFMNVATAAAIKGGLSSEDLRAVGCQIMLCNTYHLHLRPGEDTVGELGGLRGFTAWDGPVLTDSGGFQVFSLSRLRKITEEGVTFQSHIDGRRIFMRPEDSVIIQRKLGTDIAMAFDECVENPAPKDYVSASAERTVRWLSRCKEEWERDKAHMELWGINQGGTYEDLRVENMLKIAELDLPGYAIGGLAVGESAEVMYQVIGAVEKVMPRDKPRYLMGVGTPRNIIEAVALGVDIFDCVLPARNARHGHVYTDGGRLNLNNLQYARDDAPIDERCDCPVCRRYARAYLRHLFRAGEILAMRLAVIHNLHYYNKLAERIRSAIEGGTFAEFRAGYGI